MRRLDILLLGAGLVGTGALLYSVLQRFGLAEFDAGIWSEALLVGGVVLWSLTYVFRVLTKRMTYAQQLRDYEDAVLQKRLEELSPEELAKLQAEVEAERAGRSQESSQS
ncbi:DUF3007 family protein [Synechococcus elongatus IITB7]|uniref:DUF3007 family protein n=1 Tax=Synechococcus elongatus TaxID=32046 RepID=UPI0030D14F9E